MLKFIGFLNNSGAPETPYREFVDHTKARGVLAKQLKKAYDDLFLADKNAQAKSATELKGWFKTKTGASDAVAKKMATTFRALSDYANFDSPHALSALATPPKEREEERPPKEAGTEDPNPPRTPVQLPLGMVYRLEVHLPDTQNVETYRAIFRALREELM